MDKTNLLLVLFSKHLKENGVTMDALKRDAIKNEIAGILNKNEKGFDLTDAELSKLTSFYTGKWRVELVDKGGTFHANHSEQSNDGDGTIAVFYDISQDLVKFPGGQRVTSYYVDTLLGKDGWGRPENGLSLFADIPSWTVGRNDMQKILKWLDAVDSYKNKTRDKEKEAVYLLPNRYLYFKKKDDTVSFAFYNLYYNKTSKGVYRQDRMLSMKDTADEIIRLHCDKEMKIKSEVDLDEFKEKLGFHSASRHLNLDEKLLDAQNKANGQEKDSISGMVKEKER